MSLGQFTCLHRGSELRQAGRSGLCCFHPHPPHARPLWDLLRVAVAQASASPPHPRRGVSGRSDGPVENMTPRVSVDCMGHGHAPSFLCSTNSPFGGALHGLIRR